MERAVQKYLTDQFVANEEVTRTIDASYFTVPVAKCFKIVVKKRSLEKAKIDQFQKALIKAILGHRTKAEDNFPLLMVESAGSSSSPRLIYSTIKKRIQKCTI